MNIFFNTFITQVQLHLKNKKSFDINFEHAKIERNSNMRIRITRNTSKFLLELLMFDQR